MNDTSIGMIINTGYQLLDFGILALLYIAIVGLIIYVALDDSRYR